MNIEKNSQIITTISQQLVSYDEQWSVLEIAAIIKDIKEYIFYGKVFITDTSI
jgi:hypothetical protein